MDFIENSRFMISVVYINIDGENVFITRQYRMQELRENSRRSRNLTCMSNPGSAFHPKDKFATSPRN